MSDETTLPPMGYYPDPDIPGQVRWWDGTRWHASLPAYERPRLGSGFRGLGLTLAWLIGLQGALYVVLTGIYLWGAGIENSDLISVEDGPWAYLLAEILIGGIGGLAFLATTVLWCVWQYRMARSAPRDTVRRGPGMHAGSWFIPVVFWWFPYQNMKDLWTANVGRKILGLLGGWWTLWVIANLTSNVLLRISLSADVTLREYNLISLANAVLWVPLAALAAVIVVKLTRAAVEKERERDARA